MFEPSSGPRNIIAVNYDYSTSEENNYTNRPLTFNRDSTQFEWWKSKIYTHIIALDDELWDIIENDIDIPLNGVGLVTDVIYVFLLLNVFHKCTECIGV